MTAQDPVDALIAQWASERPDLGREELVAMATFAKLGRLVVVAGGAIDAVFARHGLLRGEFDVLAALRRGGEPYTTTPSRLARSLMLSPAGMTNRIDRLETMGYVRREADPDDRRSTFVVLTAAGRAKVEDALADHLTNEVALLSVLSATERKAFDRVITKLLAQFDP